MSIMTVKDPLMFEATLALGYAGAVVGHIADALDNKRVGDAALAVIAAERALKRCKAVQKILRKLER